jgi:uncharacterized membrane-anchored protein
MSQSNTPKDLAVKKQRARRADLTFWLLIPVCFAVGAGLAAFLDGRFGPAGIVTLIGIIAVVAVAVLLYPGND